ncbi:MAG: hypothetical protein H6R43_433 [Nitrospirae bacterium]|nr:hypothetical protein [Nitrospirota bacterium]
MANTSKKSLGVGIALAVSFLVVLLLIFSPIFGEGKNGLVFADDLFNKLSKGSSYFIPKVAKENEKFMGKMFAVSLKMSKSEDKPGDGEKRAERAAKLFTVNPGAKAEVMGSELKIEGDLGLVLKAALEDSDVMFKNEGDKIKTKYEAAMATDDVKQMFRQWYNVLPQISKEFAKDKKIEESKIVSAVSKKAVETAYNYYGVEAQKVSEKALLMTGLLVFYVIYTMWWGFAIFYIFDGIGLTMSKSKVKKEV